MSETVLLGQGRQIVEIPRKSWDGDLSQVPQHSETRLGFMSEEHARDYRTEVNQVEGLFLTLEQSAFSTRIVQGALFAFK
jgi:hypothetical protein